MKNLQINESYYLSGEFWYLQQHDNHPSTPTYAGPSIATELDENGVMRYSWLVDCSCSPIGDAKPNTFYYHIFECMNSKGNEVVFGNQVGDGYTAFTIYQEMYDRTITGFAKNVGDSPFETLFYSGSSLSDLTEFDSYEISYHYVPEHYYFIRDGYYMFSRDDVQPCQTYFARYNTFNLPFDEYGDGWYSWGYGWEHVDMLDSGTTETGEKWADFRFEYNTYHLQEKPGVKNCFFLINGNLSPVTYIERKERRKFFYEYTPGVSYDRNKPMVCFNNPTGNHEMIDLSYWGTRTYEQYGFTSEMFMDLKRAAGSGKVSSMDFNIFIQENFDYYQVEHIWKDGEDRLVIEAAGQFWVIDNETQTIHPMEG